MHINPKHALICGIALLFMLISYRFSVYHQTPMLTYFQTPETTTPFLRLMTYVFMMIGTLPTMLLILGVSVFCQTQYIYPTVFYTCFGNPFDFSKSEGFMIYGLASVGIAIILLTTLHIFLPKKHSPTT